MRDKVNLKEKFELIEDIESPRIAGELNGQYVKLAKLKGEFVWHRHDNEDELFYVVKGRLKMLLRDREVIINEGEFFIVPRGVEHNPVCEVETHVMLFEPKSTDHTGKVETDKRKEIEEQEWI